LTKVYLDPGHGGSDPGAVGNGLKEKDITLVIAKKMAETLQENYENVEIKMSRTDDTYPTLTQRTNEANAWGADLFVSIHVNANVSSAVRGFSTYVYPNAGAATLAFQNVMHEEIFKAVKHLKVEDDGKMQANFHVLRESNMKAILTENFFISNAADAAYLKDDYFLGLLAAGHVIGLEKFLGLKMKPFTPPPSSTKFRVIAGSFSNKENAEAQVIRLKKDGYDSFIEVKQ
jgi:N-acetylmuramoyl-L-alanine amidase